MIKILITGKKSYVGTSLESWLRKFPDRYSVKSISLRDNSWKVTTFSGYDVVLHVAGIAHMKETKENKNLYYKVNRDLAFEVAQKAKNEGIKQFIFLSSMSVYGIERGVINNNTPTKPKSNYGKSKLQAEELISVLNSNTFKVAILRPPMIYGKGCKGNYIKLAKLAVNIPFFPDVDNKRSMIYIDNLSEFIKCVIDTYASGVFFPQNNEYVKTSEMVELIAKAHSKKVWKTKLFNPIIEIILKINTINKVFGSLTYEKALSNYNFVEINRFIDFEESIRLTED